MLAVAKSGMDMDGGGVLLQIGGSLPRKAEQGDEEKRKEETTLKKGAHETNEFVLPGKLLWCPQVSNPWNFQRLNE